MTLEFPPSLPSVPLIIINLLLVPKINHIWLYMSVKAVCYGATWHKNLLIPFLHIKKQVSKSTNSKNNIITYIHSFLHFNQTPTPLKIGIQGTNLYIFLWLPKSEFLKKIKNLKFWKIRMPKKWRLNLKQNIKTYFCYTHF